LDVLAVSALRLDRPVEKVEKQYRCGEQSNEQAPMDPAIVLFGFCIGVLVGMTGMGGGSLMTPLLILIFNTSPTTAIGTDIVYSAVTKMVGSWRHLKLGTVNLELVKWLSFGSVPAAVAGVVLVSVLIGHMAWHWLERYHELGHELSHGAVPQLVALALWIVGAAAAGIAAGFLPGRMLDAPRIPSLLLGVFKRG